MREILFRGKRLYDGEWVYGFYARCADRWGRDKDLIQSLDLESGEFGFLREVDPKTVGQFTGLLDKNGKKIFEGDIVTIPGSKRQGLPATVEYFPQGAVFQIRRVGYNAITLWDANESVEVIGNIHDNPELLEAQS